MAGFTDRFEHVNWRSSRVRVFFWVLGLGLAVMQAWSNRYYMSADAISYLDMSDAVLPGYPWGRLINRVWSPLYPFILGVARRLVKPSPVDEIVFAHCLNIVFFAFALLCFEFLLRSLRFARNEGTDQQSDLLPDWAYLSLGYALFIWASLTQISLLTLRPDMLMSGLLYLAIGLVLRMEPRRPNWDTYVLLGIVLGTGYLAKAPMLPIGTLLLTSSLLFVKSWRAALVPSICATVLMLAIGSAYFVPLSRARRHFTLGESGAFNYLFHVDQAGPAWYIQNPGAGSGSLERAPAKIYDSPPTYQFSYPTLVTHPLRFDPSYWTVGTRPRFRLRSQLAALHENVHLLMTIVSTSGALIVGFLVLLFASERPVAVFQYWPLWATGATGLLMYAVIHVEHRYIGAFLVLLWLGLLCGLQPRARLNGIMLAVVASVGVSLLLPTTENVLYDFSNSLRHRDDSAIKAAVALRNLGICEGDRVARVVPMVTDLAWARVSRTMVVAEVDYRVADQFWQSSPEVQKSILHAMATSGAKLAVSYSPSNSPGQAGWQRLGSTSFWFYPLSERNPRACQQ